MVTLSKLVKKAFSPFGSCRQGGAERTAPSHGGRNSLYVPVGDCQVTELANLYRIFLGERRHGFFVEVGAFDGVSCSNTSCLADVGWSGILIEPVPAYAQACRERYRGNDNIRIVQAAVGASRGQIDIHVAGSLTTSSQRLIEAYRDISWARSVAHEASHLTVQQQTLDEILETAGAASPIDVLSVDVEGGEEAVFAGFTLARWRPTLIIIELVHTHPDLHGISAGDAAIQKMIERNGYSVVYKDAINTVFVADPPAAL